MQKGFFYFGFVMVAVYLFVGIMLVFTDSMAQAIPNNRTLFGMIVLSFGIFRAVILIQKIRKGQ